jgi:hypothetical protein
MGRGYRCPWQVYTWICFCGAWTFHSAGWGSEEVWRFMKIGPARAPRLGPLRIDPARRRNPPVGLFGGGGIGLEIGRSYFGCER